MWLLHYLTSLSDYHCSIAHNWLKPNQFAIAIDSLSKESYILIALVHSAV